MLIRIYVEKCHFFEKSLLFFEHFGRRCFFTNGWANGRLTHSTSAVLLSIMTDAAEHASSTSVKKRRIPIRCSEWLGKNQNISKISREEKPPKKVLTIKKLKEKIGICTICRNLPSDDLIQLPECGDYFCRFCLYEYLDQSATPKPVLEKVFISNHLFYRKNSKFKRFRGVFDAAQLNYDGNVLPVQLQSKPAQLKNIEDLEDRERRRCHRQTRHEHDDKELYCLVKVEEFDCPNCLHHYENINRLQLPANRFLTTILEEMRKKDAEGQIV